MTFRWRKVIVPLKCTVWNCCKKSFESACLHLTIYLQPLLCLLQVDIYNRTVVTCHYRRNERNSVRLTVDMNSLINLSVCIRLLYTMIYEYTPRFYLSWCNVNSIKEEGRHLSWCIISFLIIRTRRKPHQKIII